MDSLDVLFAFELSMATELEDQQVLYDTAVSVGLYTYVLTYIIYAAT
jgi:hypothetical protein